MPAADVAAYASVVALVVGATARLIQIIIKKRKERQEINEQLDKSPLEIKDREAALVDRRLKQLDGVNVSLSRHIKWQDEELARQDNELRECHTTIATQRKMLDEKELEIASLRRRLDEFQAGPEATV